MLASAESALKKEMLDSNGKRILFLTHVGAPGGAEYKMISMCQHLSGTEVLTFSYGEFPDLLERLNIPVHVCEMPEAMEQVRRENGLSSIMRAVPAVISMLYDVARYCRDYDVLVPMSQKAFMVAALSKPLHRKPIIWYMNDLLSREHFSPMLMWALTMLSRFTANHIVLNSQASMKHWVDAGGRNHNVTVCYPGTDVKALDAKLNDVNIIEAARHEFSPDGKALIGIVGRISPWKGQDIFLQALAQLPDVRGVIVGDALFGEKEYAEKLRHMTLELGIEDRVIFAGHREDVASIMAACDVVAHCSTSPEPFGLVIVEAMVAGAPVIATNAGGAKEIVLNGETGLLTPLGGVQALTEAIRFYLDNPEKAAEMAASARVRAERYFSNEAMMRHLQEIIEQHTRG